MEQVTLRTSRRLIYLTLFLPLIVFMIQLAFPSGWALAGLYLAPVAIAAFWSSFRHSFLVLWMGLACTILATVAFFGSSYWDNELLLITSYLVPLAMLWFLSILSLFRKARERQAATGNNRRTICSYCARVRTEVGEMPLDRYGPGHLGSIVCVGVCGDCQKRLPHDLPTQLHLRA